jgi:hypothetical protein
MASNYQVKYFLKQSFKIIRHQLVALGLLSANLYSQHMLHGSPLLLTCGDDTDYFVKAVTPLFVLLCQSDVEGYQISLCMWFDRKTLCLDFKHLKYRQVYFHHQAQT